MRLEIHLCQSEDFLNACKIELDNSWLKIALEIKRTIGFWYIFYTIPQKIRAILEKNISCLRAKGICKVAENEFEHQYFKKTIFFHPHLEAKLCISGH